MAVCRKWIDSRNRIAQFKYTRSKLEMERKIWTMGVWTPDQRSFQTMVEIFSPGSMHRWKEREISTRDSITTKSAEDRFAQKKTINYFNTISTRNFDILPGRLSFIIHFKEKSKVTGIFTPGGRGIVIMPGTMSARNSSYYVCTGWKCKSCWQSIMIRTWQYWILSSHWSYHTRHLYSRWFSERVLFLSPFFLLDRLVHAG